MTVETPRQLAERAYNSVGICGDGATIGRMIGYREDDRDCYYRIVTLGGPPVGVLWSAVGWFIPLKGAIPDDAYAFLEHVFCINGCPPATAFQYGENGDSK